MKNEWDMFATVQQQLDAGAEPVTIYMESIKKCGAIGLSGHRHRFRWH